jgi:hypothetical protein
MGTPASTSEFHRLLHVYSIKDKKDTSKCYEFNIGFFENDHPIDLFDLERPYLEIVQKWKYNQQHAAIYLTSKVFKNLIKRETVDSILSDARPILPNTITANLSHAEYRVPGFSRYNFICMSILIC